MAHHSIQVLLFGAFREFGDGKRLTLEIGADAVTVAQARTRLAARIGETLPALAALVARSAWSDDRRILADHETIQSGREFAILPPVCGG